MASSLKNLSDYDIQSVPEGSEFKVAVVVSEWNIEVTGALKDGAVKTLKKHGVKEENILVKFVPGSFELTHGAKIIIDQTSVNAVICLGCVIQGETRHFEFICQSVAQGLKDVALKYDKPVIFGVLTTDTFQQALDRAGGKYGNKGDEAAITAIKMINL